MDEFEKKVKLITAMAEIFNFKMTEGILRIYMECLKDISYFELNEIASKGIKNNRWEFMPKPGEFFTIGEKLILDHSRESATRCWDAIAKFGRNNPDEAKKYMGDLAWETVKFMGGWPSVCEVSSDEAGIFKAQFRDLSQTVSRKSEKNEINIKPPLPSPKQNFLQNVSKKIAETKMIK